MLSGVQLDCDGNSGVIMGIWTHFPVKHQLTKHPLGHLNCFCSCETEAERNHTAHAAHSSTQKYCWEPQLQKPILLWDYQQLSVGSGLMSCKTRNPWAFYLIYDLFSLSQETCDLTGSIESGDMQSQNGMTEFFTVGGLRSLTTSAVSSSLLSNISIPFTGTIISSKVILPLHPGAEPTTSHPSHDVFSCKFSRQLAFPSNLHHPRIF